MAKKGGTHHLKAVTAPQAFSMPRKEFVWTQKQLPGAHGKLSIPISTLLKQLGIAETRKEAVAVLSSRSVYVDGRIVTEEKFPIGLMDLVSIGKEKETKSWIILINEKGRISPEKTEKTDQKICRVEKKTRSKKGKMQATLHDGRTVIDYDGKVGDGLLVSIPEGKVIKKIPLEVGARCLLISGKHMGKIVKIDEITPGGAMRKAEVKCTSDGEEIITLKEYVFPIGDFPIGEELK